MASTKNYLEFVLGQLSELSDITSRRMMGEFMIYYKGKIFGGIYDNRFLVKNTKSARELMPNAALEQPYDGAKEMLLVDNIDDRDFLRELIEKMYDELPEPKKKNK
ncbi:MAG: TfoX/Sxy family protein [Oscillospiraceae bacterium]|nr:TfoX/Sxy family protein [Oscillospiraceae bacterium]